MYKYLLIIFCLTLITSCSLRHSSEQLADKTIQGEIFATTLARYYQHFSTKEATDHDWDSAKYFGDKGLRAAQGIEVDPEHPQDWEIPETFMPGLLEARRSLLDVLNGHVLNQQPKLAAKAYYLFDCWVEEQEEWQDGNIAFCRNELFATLDEIQHPPVKTVQTTAPLTADDNGKNNATALSTQQGNQPATINSTSETKAFNNAETQFVEGQKAVFEKEASAASATPQKAPATTVKKSTFKKQQFYIFFEKNSNIVTAQAADTIAEIKENIADKKTYEITVLGYISIAENTEYNEALADDRAKTVNDMLVAKGIDPSLIDFYGFTDPTGETNESEASAATNRRTEIYIK